MAPTVTLKSDDYGVIVDGNWFQERNSQWPGIAQTLQIKRKLHEQESDFQKVLVFESENHGNVLVLDGAIQCVEHDEFAYQEMITNLGMMSHPSPRRVLVIGGGDGGVLREVFKHPSVEEVELCDIDKVVTEVSKQYLKGMAAGFDNPKAKVTHDDGLQYIKRKQDYFDVIITDSSDPDGPAKALFERDYFRDCYKALRKGGILTTQAETPWNDKNQDLIREIMTEACSVFSKVEWAWASTPTYPYGAIGFFVMAKESDSDVRVPARTLSREEENQTFRYYNSAVHSAAFDLPTFARRLIDEAKAKAKAPAPAAG